MLGMLGLAACASGDTGGDAPGTTGVLPPVMLAFDELDGTTVELHVGDTAVFTGDDETFTEWRADIADESVVVFVPGRDDGSAQFNPGLTAEGVGETDVALENDATGDRVTFSVEVAE